jgi:hypothetical protein
MYFEKAMGWHEASGIINHPTYTNIFAIIAILVYMLGIREKRAVTHKDVMT